MRSYKSQNTSCDLFNKEFADKEEEDLRIKGYKSWKINYDLPNKKVVNKREKNLYAIVCKSQDKDLDSEGTENLRMWNRGGAAYYRNNFVLLIHQF